MIDSHAHLLPDFLNHQNIEIIIERARTNGLGAIINSAIEFSHFEYALILEKKYREFLYTTLGFSPSWVKKLIFKKMFNYIRDCTSLVAVGEVGLDFHWIQDNNWQQKQREFFLKFIELANEKEKPLVIHSRKAESECIDLLEQQAQVPVLMHCFAGTLDEAKRIIDSGWLISIPTAVVNRKQHRKLARALPLENIVVETDSPFLSPIQGEKNEPSNIKYAINEIAVLKETTFHEIDDITTQNAKKFYQI